MFPGNEIKDWHGIVDAMRVRLNPASIPPIDLIRSWRRIEPVGQPVDELLTARRYYIFYEHPVHAFKNRLFEATREEVLEFLGSRFNSERMEGVDVTIFSDEHSTILVGNHDGDLFVAA